MRRELNAHVASVDLNASSLLGGAETSVRYAFIDNRRVQDCRGFGTAIPAYFGLMKFYMLFMLLVLLINSIYPLVATYMVCENYNQKHICLKSGFLYYLDFNVMIQTLQEYNLDHMVDVLILLQTIVFYLLLVANLSCLFYLDYMKKKEEAEGNAGDDGPSTVLLVHNAPDLSEDSIKAYLKVQDCKIQIIKIIKLKEVKKLSQLYQKRNLYYYKLLSKYVICQNPYEDKKLNQKLYKVNEEYKAQQYKMELNSGSIIVVFKNASMAYAVHNYFRLSPWKKLFFGSKKLLKDAGVSKIALDLPISTVKIPNVLEVKWENAGEEIQDKLVGRIKAFFISIGLIILCYVLLQEPIKLTLKNDTQIGSQAADLNTFQKILPFLLSFILVGISILYRNYMTQVSKKRNPLNQFQNSKFVLLTSVLFHFIFYLIIPTIFFVYPNHINTTIKLYVIADQARTFIFVQLILSVIDVPYRMWKSRKILNLSDQRAGFKYCQHLLHKTVEYRDFPLEIRLQSMFRIWSFALFYSFFLPYMMAYMLIAISILYVLEKRNFYRHYTLKRRISLKLQSTFLSYYIYFFCIFQCCVYGLHATKDWMIYSAVTVTVVLLIASWIYWWMVQPKEEVRSQLRRQLLRDKGEIKGEVDYAYLNAVNIANQYQRSYKIFLSSLQNDELDIQINNYLVEAERPNPQILKSISQKLIQLVQTEQEESVE